MFCYQCEQTKNGTGCTEFGVCGKDPRTATLQDLLIHVCKSVAVVAERARESIGPKLLRDADRFIVEGLFTTITNVNFDPERLELLVRHGVSIRDEIAALQPTPFEKTGDRPERVSVVAA
ncbi:hydroxylamine reductase, partial [Candidatus Bipolaricaulota bacterium]|nr:hydroxylamine reductase [Candidatus Bipolaricaulota bacterium]